MTGFLRIGPVGGLDGNGEIRTLLGRAVRIWKDENGAWNAMEMVCRHQNGDLSRGERQGDIVVCPRHGWRYDLSTGDCLTEAWAALRRYEVRIEDGTLLLSQRPAAD